MTSASDKELHTLHAKVAKILSTQLESQSKAQELVDTYPDLPEEVQAFLMESCSVSPALLTVATRFLKDNSITCQIDESEELSDLQKHLNNKRTRKQIGNVLAFDEE